MSETIGERVQIMDRLINALHKKRLRRYYSIAQLKNKIAGLRLWNDEELKEHLDIMCGEALIYPKQDSKKQQVLKKVENGVELYKYNPYNYKLRKRYKEIAYSLKTTAEIREIKTKERQDFQIINWFWIKIGGFILGFISGIAATLIAEALKLKMQK